VKEEEESDRWGERAPEVVPQDLVAWVLVSAGGTQYLASLRGSSFDALTGLTSFSRVYRYIEILTPHFRSTDKVLVGWTGERHAIPVGLLVSGLGVSLRVTEMVALCDADEGDRRMFAALINGAEEARKALGAERSGLGRLG